ncbi:MAG: fimbrillin family protein [Prevotella sp.]|nr:fimbrillin family protein [Prevotella sp.]
MNKSLIFALAAAATLAACSTDELVNEQIDARHTGQVPIEFSVEKQNITRAANLETVKHYNFGVWAWKRDGKNGLDDAEVMNNYLVGWSDNAGKGYKVGSLTTTYNTKPGTLQDHVSPWYYEGLGTAEYLNTETSAWGYYTKDSTAYTSNNANQYLRYWDLAYNQTNFYCYAPYVHNGSTAATKVTFDHVKNGNSTMTFGAQVIRDGYDVPENKTYYKDYSRTLGEFMYAGVKGVNANLNDITVPFKHMGAQLFIRFYEDIPGYKVEIIDLCADNGTTGATGDQTRGIQATPSIETTPPVYYTLSTAEAYNQLLPGAWTLQMVKTPAVYYTAEEAAAYNSENNYNEGDAGYVTTSTVKTAAVYYTNQECYDHNKTLPGAKIIGQIKDPGVYNNGTYYTTQGATVTFAEATAVPTYQAVWTNSTTKTNDSPLMFQIPRTGTAYETYSVAPGNLTAWNGHNVIKEAVITGAQQYSYSPTIYYPVSQPTKDNNNTEWTNTTGTGFTFHVSYRIIAEDNKEQITVHNATVHVPCKGAVKTGAEGASEGESTTDANTWITVWQPNVKYTYTFKITRNSNGSTNPGKNIDPTDPSVSDEVALYPIVFDKADIEDYTTNYSVYELTEDTDTQYHEYPQQ